MIPGYRGVSLTLLNNGVQIAMQADFFHINFHRTISLLLLLNNVMVGVG